jgi:hypothetical protein
MRVVDPMGRPTAGVLPTAERNGKFKGGVLGTLSNGKPNADVLLDEVAGRLREALGFTEVMHFDKTLQAEGPGMAGPDWMIERLASGTVAVLTASGD